MVSDLRPSYHILSHPILLWYPILHHLLLHSIPPNPIMVSDLRPSYHIPSYQILLWYPTLDHPITFHPTKSYYGIRSSTILSHSIPPDPIMVSNLTPSYYIPSHPILLWYPILHHPITFHPTQSYYGIRSYTILLHSIPPNPIMVSDLTY